VVGQEAERLAGRLRAGGGEEPGGAVQAVPDPRAVGHGGGDAEPGLGGGVGVPGPGLLVGGHKDHAALVRRDGLQHLGGDGGLPEVGVLGRGVEHKAALGADDVVILERLRDGDVRAGGVHDGEVDVVDAVGFERLEARIALVEEVVLAAAEEIPGRLVGGQLAAGLAAVAGAAARAIAAALDHDGPIQKDPVDVELGDALQRLQEIVAPGAVDAAGVIGVVEHGIAAVGVALGPGLVVMGDGGAQDVDVEIDDDAQPGGLGLAHVGGHEVVVERGVVERRVGVGHGVKELLGVKAHLRPLGRHRKGRLSPALKVALHGCDAQRLFVPRRCHIYPPSIVSLLPDPLHRRGAESAEKQRKRTLRPQRLGGETSLPPHYRQNRRRCKPRDAADRWGGGQWNCPAEKGESLRHSRIASSAREFHSRAAIRSGARSELAADETTQPAAEARPETSFSFGCALRLFGGLRGERVRRAEHYHFVNSAQSPLIGIEQAAHA